MQEPIEAVVVVVVAAAAVVVVEEAVEEAEEVVAEVVAVVEEAAEVEAAEGVETEKADVVVDVEAEVIARSLPPTHGRGMLLCLWRSTNASIAQYLLTRRWKSRRYFKRPHRQTNTNALREDRYA